MSHVIQLDLDYGDIWENIRETAEMNVDRWIDDLAWGAVQYQVSDEVDSRLIGMMDADDVNREISSLLLDYGQRKRDGRDLCSTGEAFQEAVRAATDDVSSGLSVTAVREIVRGELRDHMNDVLATLGRL